MPSALLIYPLLAHILWMVLLYILLTAFRAPAVWGIGATISSEARWRVYEPRVSANLSNQFEWPVLFYAICILLMSVSQTINSAYVWAAWLFIVGRLIHSAVQVLTGNIRLRGLVFTINFVSVLAMWFLYAAENL